MKIKYLIALIAVGAASVSFLTFSRDLPVWSEA